jgi:hypothetical protein
MTAFLRVVWQACGGMAEGTAAVIKRTFRHLKRGGSVAGAAGLASRDPEAQRLFLAAVREAGL